MRSQFQNNVVLTMSKCQYNFTGESTTNKAVLTELHLLYNTHLLPLVLLFMNWESTTFKYWDMSLNAAGIMLETVKVNWHCCYIGIQICYQSTSSQIILDGFLFIRDILQHLISCEFAIHQKSGTFFDKNRQLVGLGIRIMVFNATFYNNSVISLRSILLVEETRVPLIIYW